MFLERKKLESQDLLVLLNLPMEIKKSQIKKEIYKLRPNLFKDNQPMTEYDCHDQLVSLYNFDWKTSMVERILQ